jgi:hypothetical protein
MLPTCPKTKFVNIGYKSPLISVNNQEDQAGVMHGLAT